MTWRFLNTGFHDGRSNMAFDQLLAHLLAEGTGCPTVRVYGWQPRAISLGFHQRETDVDRERCAADGIDVVRRPTGGRAILHEHEVTYSVVTCAEGRTIMEVYAHISRALILSLKYLGVDADAAPAPAGLSGSGAGVACFAASSRFEIQVGGKKIVGSAQRRYGSTGVPGKDVVLQHGSILLGPQHRKLADYLSDRRPNDGLILEQRTTEVEAVLGRPVSFDEGVLAVRMGFAEIWGEPSDADEEGTIDGRAAMVALPATNSRRAP